MNAEEIQTSISRLHAALAAGQLTVTIGEQTVTYRSVSDLLKALAYFKKELADLANGCIGSGHSEQAIAGRRALP